jgi:hypothetical protein
VEYQESYQGFGRRVLLEAEKYLNGWGVSVAPTGVDLAQFRAAAGESATEPLVMFVGSMDWEANIDGCAYFRREIWRIPVGQPSSNANAAAFRNLMPSGVRESFFFTFSDLPCFSV